MTLLKNIESKNYWLNVCGFSIEEICSKLQEWQQVREGRKTEAVCRECVLLYGYIQPAIVIDRFFRAGTGMSDCCLI